MKLCKDILPLEDTQSDEEQEIDPAAGYRQIRQRCNSGQVQDNRNQSDQTAEDIVDHIFLYGIMLYPGNNEHRQQDREADRWKSIINAPAMPARAVIPQDAECRDDQLLPDSIFQQVMPSEESNCEEQPHAERTRDHEDRPVIVRREDHISSDCHNGGCNTDK